MSTQHFMSERSVAFLLASLLTAYPDASFVSNVRTLLDDPEANAHFGQFSESWPKLYEQLLHLTNGKIGVETIQADYVSRFDRGRSLSPLYESEYGKGRTLAKGNEMADISAFYKAFGFQLGDGDSTYEMHDHISVELEFYSLLIAKQDYLYAHQNNEGVEIVFDARRKFLTSHLGRFVPALTKRVLEHNDPYLAAVYNWLNDLVADECRGLGASPNELEFAMSFVPDISCGSTSSRAMV